MVPVADLPPLTPVEAELQREVCGLVRVGDRPPTRADVAVILDARVIIEREWRRWHGLDPPGEPP